MRKLSLSALLAVIVWSTIGGPAAAADCCPGSGCCGSGQTYVGNQLFPNPAGPFQVGNAPAASALHPIKSAETHRAAGKRQAAQAEATAVAVSGPRVPTRSREALTVSCSPVFGSLW
jgi:hypothetical protein